MTLRVLLVDDQAMVRAGFRMILDIEDDISVVGEADDGDSAVTVATRLRPDIVLMDIQMPRTDGIEATRHIVGAGATTTRVLILTTFERDEYIFEALRAGASGFLLKNAHPRTSSTACASSPPATPSSPPQSPDGSSRTTPPDTACHGRVRTSAASTASPTASARC